MLKNAPMFKKAAVAKLVRRARLARCRGMVWSAGAHAARSPRFCRRAGAEQEAGVGGVPEAAEAGCALLTS